MSRAVAASVFLAAPKQVAEAELRGCKLLRFGSLVVEIQQC